MASRQAELASAETPSASSRKKPLFVELPTLWKSMILTSFIMNLVLLFVLIFIGLSVFWWREPIFGTTANVQVFAKDNVAELRDVVQQLQLATIKAKIPVDQPLPLKGAGVVVPVNQVTEVTLTEPVALNLSNADIDLGGGNRLRASNIALSLPEGTRLPIRLNMNIPLDDVVIPVKLNVDVNIPMRDTELAPQFQRLGNVVDRLAYPAQSLLGIDIPKPPPPQVPNK